MMKSTNSNEDCVWSFVYNRERFCLSILKINFLYRSIAYKWMQVVIFLGCSKKEMVVVM